MRRRDVLVYGSAAGVSAALGPRLGWSREAQYAPQALTLFQGLNSVTGAARLTALRGTFQPKEGRSHAEITVCDSISKFKKIVEIDASVTVGLGAIGGASGKVSWAQSLEIDEQTVSIVARAQKTPATNLFKNAALNKAAENYLARNDASPLGFCRIYGDSWIASVTLGGEYLAVYLFSTSSTEEKSSLVLSLKANGISGTFSADASFDKKVTEFRRNERKFTDFKQLITGFTNPPEYPNAENIGAFANKFGTLQLTAPAVLAYSTQGYDRIDSLVTAFDDVTKARRYFLGDPDAGVLPDTETGLMSKRQVVIAKRNALARITKAQKLYRFPADTTANTNARIIADDLRAINGQVEKFSSNPAQDFPKLNLRSRPIGMPYLLVRAAQSPRFGGGGTARFDDVGNPRLAVLDLRKPYSIRLCYWQTYNPQSASFAGVETTFVTPDDRKTVVLHAPNAVRAGELIWTQPLLVYDSPLASIESQHNPGRTISALRLRNEDGAIETPFLPDATFQVYARSYGTRAASWTRPPGETFLGFAGSVALSSTPALVCEIYPQCCTFRAIEWRD